MPSLHQQCHTAPFRWGLWGMVRPLSMSSLNLRLAPPSAPLQVCGSLERFQDGCSVSDDMQSCIGEERTPLNAVLPLAGVRQPREVPRWVQCVRRHAVLHW